MYAFVKFSSAFILMMPYSIYGDVRHNFFSNQDDDELTGEIFAIFDRQNYSRVRCGILCLEDQCCEGFLYSASTRRCIGRHFMWFSSSSSDNSVYTMYEGMTSYKKGAYSPIAYLCADLKRNLVSMGSDSHLPPLEHLNFFNSCSKSLVLVFS